MKRLQTIVVFLLFLAPMLTLLAAGTWALWIEGWLFALWWILPVCWGLAFVLQRWWKTFLIPMPGVAGTPPMHWTPRDRQAATLIEARQKRVGDIAPARLAEPAFYVETSREVCLEIARHYHPNTPDAWSSATISELLAAAELAIADLEEWANRYLPGSQLISLRTWQTLSRANRWMDAAYYTYWLSAIVVNPLNLGRFFASKLAIEPLSGQIQANALGLFYVFFVRQVGFYAIEMNSGRLRGGVAKYRAAMAHCDDARRTGFPPDANHEPAAPTASPSQQGAPQPAGTGSASTSSTKPAGSDKQENRSPGAITVTIAVVGQVKAGKSSLVNAMLGERLAGADVLPLTQNATEYRLLLGDSREGMVIVDTAGYGADAPGERSWRDSLEAVRRADIVLLVLKSTSPARSADLSFVEAMHAWYREHPDRKPPQILAVLTHIDGLSPAMEWSPPYQWETPTGAKEEHIRDAVEHAAATLAPHVAGVIPICGDANRGRVYGVSEWLVPAVFELLGEARGAAVVRSLHADLDAARFRQVLTQVRNAGKQLLSLLVERAKG